MLWSIFFQTHIPIQLILFSPFTPLDEDTKLNCQKTLDLEVVHKWLTGKSLPVTKTPIFTASPILLEIYRTFPNLYIVEKPNMLLEKHLKILLEESFFSCFSLENILVMKLVLYYTDSIQNGYNP